MREIYELLQSLGRNATLEQLKAAAKTRGYNLGKMYQDLHSRGQGVSYSVLPEGQITKACGP
jgi:hypothetical protein